MSRVVLVTGGAGFVGSHLVERILEETDWRVISIDSFQCGGTFSNLIDACGWERERITSVTHDLTVPFSFSQYDYFSQQGIDAVINIASRSHVAESIDSSTEFVSNNTQLMLYVLELALELDVNRFIQMSTDEVYGPNQPETATDYRPSSPYAASKAAQESLCLAWQRTFNLPITIVNSANMIGERQQDAAFLPLVIRHLQRNQTVSVHTHNGQLGTRHYSYVGNVVDELLAELRRDTPTGRLQLGGQRTLSNLELLEEVAVIMGVQPKWVLADAELDRPGYDQSYPSLDGGWMPRVPFGKALERTVRWYLDR